MCHRQPQRQKEKQSEDKFIQDSILDDFSEFRGRLEKQKREI